MFKIRSVCGLLLMFALQMCGKEVSRDQQAVYPENPTIVVGAGVQFKNSNERDEFIASMKKASEKVHTISCIAGAAAVGCFGLALYTNGIKTRVVSLVMAGLCAAAGSFLLMVSKLQARMASNCEMVSVSEATQHVLPNIADGIYIFGQPHRMSCKQLHDDMGAIERAFPALKVYHCDIVAERESAQALLSNMGVHAQSLPLVVVVKEHVIVRIIVGYTGFNDFVEQMSGITL